MADDDALEDTYTTFHVQSEKEPLLPLGRRDSESGSIIALLCGCRGTMGQALRDRISAYR